MRSAIVPGAVFPDYALPPTGTPAGRGGVGLVTRTLQLGASNGC
jgi:hypothetical protein